MASMEYSLAKNFEQAQLLVISANFAYSFCVSGEADGAAGPNGSLRTRNGSDHIIYDLA
jgi:hypothetical protein